MMLFVPSWLITTKAQRHKTAATVKKSEAERETELHLPAVADVDRLTCS